MTARAKNRKLSERHLLQEQWPDFKLISQRCFLDDLLLKLLKGSYFLNNVAARDENKNTTLITISHSIYAITFMANLCLGERFRAVMVHSFYCCESSMANKDHLSAGTMFTVLPAKTENNPMFLLLLFFTFMFIYLLSYIFLKLYEQVVKEMKKKNRC